MEKQLAEMPPLEYFGKRLGGTLQSAGRAAGAVMAPVTAPFRGLAATTRELGPEAAIGELSASLRGLTAPRPSQNIAESFSADIQSAAAPEKPRVPFQGTMEQAQELAAPYIGPFAERVGEVTGLAAQQVAQTTGMDPRLASEVGYYLGAGAGQVLPETLVSLLAGAAEDPTIAIGFVRSVPRIVAQTDRALAGVGAVGLSAGAVEAFGAAQEAAAQGDWRSAAQ